MEGHRTNGSRLIDIYNAHIEEMKSVLKTSELLLLKDKKAMTGELNTSGKLCEDFIKNLIKTYLPSHLRITSGYILNSEKIYNEDNLPQFDLLIVDSAMPPIYKFRNLDIELVMTEAVCGIFEIKRCITTGNLKKFANKLSSSVLKYSELHKDVKYETRQNCINQPIETRPPLIGIISLTNAVDNQDINYLSGNKNIVDFVWAIDELSILPYIKQNENYILLEKLCRPKNKSFDKLKSEQWKGICRGIEEFEICHRLVKIKDKPEIIMLNTIGYLMDQFYRFSNRIITPYDVLVKKYYGILSAL